MARPTVPNLSLSSVQTVPPPAADLDAELDRLLEALAIDLAGLVAQLDRGCVQLLEDPRDRGQVRRARLDQLLDDPLGSAAVVDDHAPQVVGRELRGQRERVCQG